jgi:alginate O-acetyltransferase complex protein AlgI
MVFNEIVYCIIIILCLLFGEWYLRASSQFSNAKKISIAASLIIACYFLGIFNETQFIYFQF